MQIVSLADRPDLLDAVARLRWIEWGEEQSFDEWVEVTRAESGRDALPITLVAIEGATALGCLALGPVDNAMTEAERAGRTPWLLGTVTHRDHRKEGVGRSLLTAAESLAYRSGYAETWVVTGGEAVGYYEACGWRRVQALVLEQDGDASVVLHKIINR